MPGTLVFGTVVSICEGLEVHRPVRFLCWLKGSQHRQQRAIEPLRHTVALWVVWRRLALLHAKQVTQLLYDCRLKTLSLV